jgi:hypothetical protein
MRILMLAAALAAAAPATAEVAMFSQRHFQGARYNLESESPNMSFSPRSIRVVEGQPWQICPRPFFGGDCRIISSSEAKLSLPRAFSGVVRSARPAPGAAPAASPQKEEGEPKAKDTAPKS